jgi:hypothetical protein
MRRPSFVRCDAQPSQRSCGACAKLIAIRWRAPDAPVPAHRTFEADVFEWPTRGWVWPTSPLINDRTAKIHTDYLAAGADIKRSSQEFQAIMQRLAAAQYCADVRERDPRARSTKPASHSNLRYARPAAKR